MCIPVGQAGSLRPIGNRPASKSRLERRLQADSPPYNASGKEHADRWGTR